MQAQAWSELIRATHASGCQAVLAITGGGSGAIAEILRIPGGSKLLLEALVPYDARALEDFLGAPVEQACSEDTAAAMADRAQQKAAALAHPDTRPIGLGATASLASDRPKKGDHRFHVAVASASGVDLVSVVLAKGQRDRAEEEDVVARAIVLCLARACGIAAPAIESVLGPEDRCSVTSRPAVSLIDQLVAGTPRPRDRASGRAGLAAGEAPRRRPARIVQPPAPGPPRPGASGGGDHRRARPLRAVGGRTWTNPR